MVGQLSPEEIEAFLWRSRIGRIGYCVDDRPCIVPITYAYDGTAVYVSSGPGQKVDAMRARTQICFEVDDIDGSAVWRSVIADGVYEELTRESERCAALSQISRASAAQTHCGADGSDDVIVFRIRLHGKTGRFGRDR
jgi:uncharacterized protein